MGGCQAKSKHTMELTDVMGPKHQTSRRAQRQKRKEEEAALERKKEAEAVEKVEQLTSKHAKLVETFDSTSKAARVVSVFFFNSSKRVLYRHSLDGSGVWDPRPPKQIKPMSIVGWTVESPEGMAVTRTTVTYSPFRASTDGKVTIQCDSSFGAAPECTATSVSGDSTVKHWVKGAEKLKLGVVYSQNLTAKARARGDTGGASDPVPDTTIVSDKERVDVPVDDSAASVLDAASDASTDAAPSVGNRVANGVVV